MRPETHYAKSGDVLIAYQVTGNGADTLVLAPGNLSHLDLDWELPLRAEFFQRLSLGCGLAYRRPYHQYQLPVPRCVVWSPGGRRRIFGRIQAMQ
jgi:hypothetical protein